MSYLHTSLCQYSWRPHDTDPEQVPCVTNGKFGGPTEKTQAKEQQTIESFYFLFSEVAKNWLTAFKKPHGHSLANMVEPGLDSTTTIPFHVFKMKKLLLKMPFPVMRGYCSTSSRLILLRYGKRAESWAMERIRKENLSCSLYFLYATSEAESRFKLATCLTVSTFPWFTDRNSCYHT